MNKEEIINILTEELGFVNYINVTKYIAELDTEIIILRDNWNKLKEHLWNLRNVAFTKKFGNEWNNCLSFNEDILPIINKMQELEDK